MEIVSRSTWGATAGLGPAMKLPARECWLHHSVSAVSSDPKADMRVLERIGVQRFGRFSYSWAVHPNGTVLEGAGTTVGAHTAGRNSFSFGVVLIGNYEQHRPTDPQIRNTAALIRHLIDTGRLVRGAPLGGHRDVAQTACPGRNAYPELPRIRALITAPDLQEDDMPTPEELRPVIREEVLRGILFALTGQPNQAYRPAETPELASAVTGPRLLQAVNEVAGDVDADHIATRTWVRDIKDFPTVHDTAADYLRDLKAMLQQVLDALPSEG